MIQNKLFILTVLAISGFIISSAQSGLVFAQGTTIDDEFFSISLDADREVDVHLPQGYDENTDTRYPVIYFLHGANSDHNTYNSFFGVVDAMIEAGELEPVIVAIPDGRAFPYAGSFYTNSSALGLFEDYIYKDLIEYIDDTYRTIPEKQSRAIIGHSMGGYGAMKIALKHPELFDAVAAHNAPLDFNTGITPTIEKVREEAGSNPPYEYYFQNGAFTYLALSISVAFSPDPDDPPYYTDFILDPNGEVIDSIRTKWLTHSPGDIIRTFDVADSLRIYFDSGTNDELLVHPFNTGFADSLDAYEIPYTKSYDDGGHSTNLLSRFENSIAFVQKAFTVVSNEKHPQIASTFELDQNYPNPFNPTTNISFSLPEASGVSLKVYNLIGQEVASIVDRKLNAGNHTVTFKADELPSGVYIYSISNGGQNITKKMTLIK